MDHKLLLWGGFLLFILFMLAIDLGLFSRKSKDHIVTSKEALVWTGIWAALSLAFAGVLWLSWDWISPGSSIQHTDATVLYLTGWLVEYSLSMDNIFVIVLLFRFFKIPPVYQRNVLLWGILGALVFRGALIGAGTALVAQFSWVLYLFGAFLLFTGLKMLLSKESGEGDDAGDSAIVKAVKKFLPVTDEIKSHHFFVRQNGKLWATPLFLALVVIEATDVVFAFDSIPAIFSITTEPVLVFTSNVFAILGLRSLYFLLQGMVDAFRFLKAGLSTLLIFIGAKMLLEHWIHFSPLQSLVVIVGVLGIAIGASLLWPNPKKQD
jgi:tellurite resistance protein TerC